MIIIDPVGTTIIIVIFCDRYAIIWSYSTMTFIKICRARSYRLSPKQRSGVHPYCKASVSMISGGYRKNAVIVSQLLVTVAPWATTVLADKLIWFTGTKSNNTFAYQPKPRSLVRGQNLDTCQVTSTSLTKRVRQDNTHNNNNDHKSNIIMITGCDYHQ